MAAYQSSHHALHTVTCCISSPPATHAHICLAHPVLQVWNSTVSEDRKRSILSEMVCDEPSMRLLYTTPEALQNPKLREYLKVGSPSYLAAGCASRVPGAVSGRHTS